MRCKPPRVARVNINERVKLSLVVIGNPTVMLRQLLRCSGPASLATTRVAARRFHTDFRDASIASQSRFASHVAAAVVGGCAALGLQHLKTDGWLERLRPRWLAETKLNTEPPPVALRLEHPDGQRIRQQQCLGLYRLETRKINGQPACRW